MFNIVEIGKGATITEQALQTVNTDQKMIGPGINERIAQALITTITRSNQTEEGMAKKNLNACLARLSNLYGINIEDTKIFLENIIKKNPEDLKVIYADIIKDARIKVYTGWTIVSIYNLILISASIAFSPIFLIPALLTIIIIPILYDVPKNAGQFLIDAKKIKKVVGEDYCPFELMVSK